SCPTRRSSDLGSRLVTAAATGLLWSTINAHTAAIVSTTQIGRATAVVLFGGTLGTVAAIPAGNAIAAWIGWRAPFLTLAVLSLLAAAAVATVLRRYPARPETQPAANDAAGVSRRRGLGRVLLTAALGGRSEEHTSELQSRFDLVCRLLLE